MLSICAQTNVVFPLTVIAGIAQGHFVVSKEVVAKFGLKHCIALLLRIFELFTQREGLWACTKWKLWLALDCCDGFLCATMK